MADDAALGGMMNRKLTISVCLCLALLCAHLFVPGHAQARKKDYVLAGIPWELDQKAITASLSRRHWQHGPGRLGATAGKLLSLSFACCRLVPEEVTDMVTTLAMSNFKNCQRVDASNGKGMTLGMVFSQATGKILCYEFSDKDIKGLATHLRAEFRRCQTAECQGTTEGRANRMPYCQAGDLIVLSPNQSNRVLVVYLSNIAAHLQASRIKPVKAPPPPC